MKIKSYLWLAGITVLIVLAYLMWQHGYFSKDALGHVSNTIDMVS